MHGRITILNVDDTDAMRYGKTRVLRAAGYEVVEADTGAAALRLVRELSPDLVLMDVKLPDMSGIEACRVIKSDPATLAIPVIQISATFITEKDQKSGLQGGADIYLTEPLEPKVLETVVSVLLQLRRTEAGLRETVERERVARAQAEEATRLKDEFLANLSHELRTPMNIIIGWAHLLRNGPLSDEQKARAAEAIERAARSQAQLIEDLLDVSRIVTGKFRMEMQDVEIGVVVKSAVDSLRMVAGAKQILVSLTQEAGDVTIKGDPDRLQQVFWNLLSNAVKFTPANGCIDVRMHKTEADVVVTVTDTGVGISSDFLPHVFDRFRQADSTSTRQHTGMGLGLAIVRHVVELHGGTARAQSAGENNGSSFIISLPLPNGDEAITPPATPASACIESSAAQPRRWRVLLVEDDADAREVTVAGLEKAGFELRAAATANEALSLLDRWVPDVIVSDIGMPGVDGYEFMRTLRSRPPEQGGRVAALALTAFARLEDAVRARASGYQGHLAKPVSPEDLAAAVAKLQGKDEYDAEAPSRDLILCASQNGATEAPTNPPSELLSNQ
jgi:signal transduction histidine kinase